MDYDINGNTTEQYNITMRRYACMALTNLTFGDGTNKALLCSMKPALAALVAQLSSPNEDLRQVAASVLRNLSWRADLASKKTLREVGCVTALTCACMEVSKESTLKSILSALWNLSAHCSENKADVCAVDNALAFLVGTLGYKSLTKTLAIIENGGGILRNVSSHIAVREDYRQVLRKHGCLQILLKHLRSPSLTIVSNACGTLWNISARCPEDQRALWEMGAVSMLRNLVHSKHKMISMGSAAALKNLLSAKPALGIADGDRFNKSNLPGLHVRKQRALEAELASQDLAETCENMESPQSSPTESRKYTFGNMRPKCVLKATDNGGAFPPDEYALLHRNALLRGQRSASSDRSPLIESCLNAPQQKSVSRSSSQDSIGSIHSDISHDRAPQHAMVGRGGAKLRHALSEHKKNGQDVHPNSRIMQVMQEVAMHAGIDAGPYVKEYRCESHSADNTPPSVRKLPGGRSSTGGRSQIPLVCRSSEFSRDPQSGDSMLNSSLQFESTFANVTQRIEDMCRDSSEPEQDEPINYSIKYSETPQTVPSSPSGSAFAKPLSKPGAFADTRSMPFNGCEKLLTVKTGKENAARSATNGYTKSDLDMETLDQPTNYSIRFAEQDDDNNFTDQPINYSTRYSEADDQSCDVNVAPQPQGMFEPCVNDDNVRTYCTEGTPLTYLSTATSTTDLSNKPGSAPAPGVIRVPGQKPAVVHVHKPNGGLSNACSESEHMSGTGSHSTGQNTGSTVILKNPPPDGGSSMQREAKSSPPETKPPSQPASLYSYNDSSASGSPSEKLTKYCTEGTPLCFSRVSSLSSLHSSDAHDSPPPAANQSKPDGALQSIDENRSLDVSANSQNDVTLKHEDSFPSGNATLSHATPPAGGATKCVTFDENNQVEETPLMFSRCSSLGSLSSFDTHSVHSSVVSEYSRRASEVVSPSDLPDSPSETMPPSPSHCKSPARLDSDSGAKLKLAPGVQKVAAKSMGSKAVPTALCDRGKTPGKDSSGSDHSVTAFTAETLVSYAVEDFPSGALSTTGSSLSALTIDDEPRIVKEPDLRCVPLGKERDTPPEINTTGSVSSHENLDATVITVKEVDVGATAKDDDKVDEDDDNDSVSEGEEEMIAQCISLAMPANSKKKMRKSSSENSMKRRLAYPVTKPGCASSSTGHIGGVDRLTPLRTSTSFPGTGLEDTFDTGGDSVCKFATEGTPLNFSSAASLSDISVDLSDDQDECGLGKATDNVPSHSHMSSKGNSSQMDDAKSDFSSFSEDNEDLLSEAIQSAMPKSKKASKKTTEHNRSSTGRDMSSGRRASSSNGNVPEMMHASHGDTVKNYATEDIPTGAVLNRNAAPDLFHNDAPSSHDSPRMFAVEGTPMSFSCNDSLSSVSCDEDADLTSDKLDMKIDTGPADGAIGCMTPHSKLFTPRKPGIQSPLIARLKSTPCKKVSSEPSMHSTPLGKHDHDENPKMYVVEGTPMCFSRNSSLSSLDSDDHEALANHNAEPAAASHDNDQNATFGEEDTPANFSANSSLSSLSVESLSFEPTPSESALLEECINAAMPKSRGKKRKDTRLPLPASSGSRLRASPKEPSARSSDAAAVEQSSSENQSKNAQGPQVRTDGGRPQVDEAGRRMEAPSLPMSVMQKQCKDATNREKLHSATRACAAGFLSLSDNRFEDDEKPDSHAESELEKFVAETGLKSSVTDELVSFSLEALLAGDDGGGKESDETCISDTEQITDVSNGDKCGDDLIDAFQDVDEGVDGVDDVVDTSDSPPHEHVDESDRNDVAMRADIDVHVTEPDIDVHVTEPDIDELPQPDDDIDEYDDVEVSSEIFESATQLAERMVQSTDSVLSLRRHLMVSCDAGEESDIMKESFPDMSSSLVSDITTPGDEDRRLVLGGSTGPPGEMAATTEEEDTERTCEAGDDDAMEATVVEKPGTEDAAVDISTEEEQALQENISIILSELSLTRQLSSSTLGEDDDDDDNDDGDSDRDDIVIDDSYVCVDDDIFIANETLSLVSNDYMSDATSDVSVTMSASSRTMSEHRSDATYDLSGSRDNISDSDNANDSDNEIEIAAGDVTTPTDGAESRKGPRILTPGEASRVQTARQQQQVEEEPANGAIKVVRGRRRPLSAPRVVRSVTSSATKTVMTMSTLSPGGPRARLQGAPKKPLPSANRAAPKPPQKSLAAGTSPQKAIVRPTGRPAPKTPPRSSSIATTRAAATRVASPRTPPTKTPPAKPSPCRAQPANRTPVSRITPMTNGQKGTPKAAAIKASPRTGIKPPGTTARPSPTSTKSSLPVIGKPSGGVGSSIPGPSRLTSPRAKPVVAAGSSGVERPKPLIKQGTFTKELTTDDMNKSADELSDDTDHNGNEVSAAEGSETTSSNRKSTEVEDQEKGICEGRLTKVTPPRAGQVPAPRAATAAPQASWSNALGGHSFVVDTSQKDGFSAPYKQLQVQRNSNKPPPAMTPKTVVTKTVVVKSSGVPTNSRSLLAKKSATALTKASSGGSLNKSSSGSSLNQSTRSIPGARTPVRASAALNKSDSSSSVNRTGRSTTPAGRRQSPAGSASSESSSSSTVTNKKAAVSKIAGLWKRDGQKASNAKSTPVKIKTPQVKAVTPPKRISSLTNARRSLPVGTKFNADSSTTPENDAKDTPTQQESLPKSSTYDKLPVAGGSGADLSDAGSDEADSSAVPRNPPSNASEQSKLWRRTYTIDDPKPSPSTSAAGLDDGKKAEPAGKNKKSSIWRRPKTKSAKSEPAKPEQKSEQPKKRFSLWRRDTSDSAKVGNKAGGSKIPGLLGVGEKKDRTSVGERVECDAPAGDRASSDTTTGMANSPTRPSTLSPLSSPPRPAQNAAIVPPFNYTPAQPTTKVAVTVVDAGPKQLAPPVAPSPTRPTTKTEMLMARRRSYLNSLKAESGDDVDRSKRSSCLVTTV